MENRDDPFNSFFFTIMEVDPQNIIRQHWFKKWIGAHGAHAHGDTSFLESMMTYTYIVNMIL